MTVFENHDRWDRSNVVYRDGLVVRYEKGLAEPPPDMVWIDYGLSVLTRDVVVQHVGPGGRGDLAPLCRGWPPKAAWPASLWPTASTRSVHPRDWSSSTGCWRAGTVPPDAAGHRMRALLACDL